MSRQEPLGDSKGAVAVVKWGGEGRFEFEEAQTPVVEGQNTLVARDFDALAAGDFGGGSVEVTGFAAAKITDGHGGIFDFDGVEAGIGDSLNGLGRATSQPDELVEGVGGLVHQDAATFTLPGAAPGSGAIVGLRAIPGRGHGDTVDFAELAIIDHVFHFAAHVLGALLEHDTEENAAFLASLDHGIGGGNGDGNGFLAQDMDAFGSGVLGNGGMKEVRRGDEDGLDAAIINQVVSVGEGFRTGFFGDFLRGGFVDIGDSD